MYLPVFLSYIENAVAQNCQPHYFNLSSVQIKISLKQHVQEIEVKIDFYMIRFYVSNHL